MVTNSPTLRSPVCQDFGHRVDAQTTPPHSHPLLSLKSMTWCTVWLGGTFRPVSLAGLCRQEHSCRLSQPQCVDTSNDLSTKSIFRRQSSVLPMGAIMEAVPAVSCRLEKCPQEFFCRQGSNLRGCPSRFLSTLGMLGGVMFC